LGLNIKIDILWDGKKLYNYTKPLNKMQLLDNCKGRYDGRLRVC